MAKKKAILELEEEVSTASVETPVNKGKTKMVDKNQIIDLDMNLEDYEDFEPLPVGEYPGTCIQSEMRTSDKGNDFYYLVFRVDPADYPVDYAPENAPEGLRLTWARTQKPTAANRRSVTGVKNLLRALGKPLNVSRINPGEWENAKAKLIVVQGDWLGEVNNQIARLEALDD